MKAKLVSSANKPVVLCFSGHDSSGGAGIQADIETLAALGCHCAPVITAITAQNTHDIIRFQSTDGDLLRAQAEAVLKDMEVRAFKIGLVSSIECIICIAEILNKHPGIPVVLDPVFKTGGGTQISNADMIAAQKKYLLPSCTLVCPNSYEAQKLAHIADNTDSESSHADLSLETCADLILQLGAKGVLITGGHEDNSEIINRLWLQEGHVKDFNSPRLDGEFHGTGCTLASAIAAGLALGNDVIESVENAQQFTFQSIKNADNLGHGQSIPRRV